MRSKNLLRRSLYMAIISAIPALACAAAADQAVPTLGAITVQAPTPSAPGPISILSGPATGYEINQEALPTLGGPGQVNPYMALTMLPSVVAQNPDAYGLGNIVGGTKGIRIRGESNPHGAIGTVDGLPLYGIDPGPGSLFLFDMEDISHISVYEGAIPPDKLAIFTTQGVLNSDVLWPQKGFGGTISQSFGSFDFHRTFVRLDSGDLSTGTRAFASFSYTHADSWQGTGASPGYRYNGEVGISQRFSRNLVMRLYAAYNDMNETNPRPLNYAQATNLGANYNLGYNAALTGNPGQDINYYQYNQQKFQNYALFGEIDYRLANDTTIAIKPFYSQENGYYRYGQSALPGTPSTPGVLQWNINHDGYGVVSQIATTYVNTHFKLGYWFENLQPPGPPTSWDAYEFANNGALASSPVSWIQASPTAGHLFNSPFFQMERTFDRLSVTAGARYMIEQTPSINVYDVQGKPTDGKDNVSGRNIDEWLPYLGLTYQLAPAVHAVFSYGRNYGAPAFNDWVSLLMMSGKLPGGSVQQAWSNLQAETSNSFNLGLQVQESNWFLKPTLFYTTYHNKIVSIYDQNLGIGYYQNAGNAHSYGVELAAGVNPLPDLSIFGSLTYSRAVLDQNFQVAAGSVIDAQGKQIPDTPRLIANFGATYRYRHFFIAPRFQYMGTRYADSQNQQPIAGYFLANLDLGYRQRVAGLGKLQATLSFANLFNRHYIGVIDSSYLQSPSNVNFYAGAPLTVAGTVSLRF
ncbi:TonB-dependent receptor [Acidithiobacillus sp.]|uniref:TonB-dependent receptor n=1 Tax=Acidithiobacillus sp. TaxID=1872118 RepID=UPI003D039988